MRLIELYLPQFHPIPENDEWYGKGFTEWTNVAQAKPLFKGHKQPRIPADLGFYDLRLPEVRHAQEQMAKDHGIDGFAYYDYWFGNGKRLLERPLNDMLADKEDDFPFMLHWANGSWYQKMWNADGKGDRLLIEQTYPGDDDAREHFYALLPAFKDKRYIRMEGKLLFTIDQPTKSENIYRMMDIWRELAAKEGIGDFFFLAHAAHNEEMTKLQAEGVEALLGKDGIYAGHYDGMVDSQYRKVMYHDLAAKAKFVLRKKAGMPNTYQYEDAVKIAFGEYDKDERCFPEVFPRFDHSPRSKGKELIYVDDSPELFREYVAKAVDIIKDKPEERQIVFIRAWNEWGEGNYLEPDIDSGMGYLEAVRKAREGNK